MNFTQKELALIAAAKKKSSSARLMRVLILISMLGGLALMLGGLVDSDRFAYFAFAGVLYAVAMPQFGGGPQYEDLVALLESKSGKDSSPAHRAAP